VSPTPIIELQRRLTLVGAIRAGGERPPRGPGRKLESVRLTSPRRELVEQAASLYGGEVSPWKSPVGQEWQVYTQAPEIPVLVMPGYSLRQSYELWEGATKRTRLCDGVDEELSGGPCLCNSEGVDRCDLYTRLVVALPELDTVLGWRLITRGANAGHELPTMMALLEAKGGTFVPARLRLDQRRGVKDGQVVRYVVPIIDLGAGYAALAAAPANGPAALPPGRSFIPAEARNASVAQALDAVAEPPPASTAPPGRQAAPMGPRRDRGPTAPLPVDDDEPGSYEQQRQTLAATEAQAKKLNVQVGQLRDAGHITTEHIWNAIANLRNTTTEQLVDELGGRDTDGVLHWSPLRDSLTRPEAVQLIERLTAKEQDVGRSEEQQQEAFKIPDAARPTAQGDFPEGY
jgi:recombination directionality factor gp3-like protein